MKNASYVLCFLLGLGYLAFAAQHDFSGNWALDQGNGVAYGNALPEQSPNADSGILITHTGIRLLVESQCVKCGKPVRDYLIDGTMRNMPNSRGALISYSAQWDGDMLVINEGFGGPTPFGGATVTTHQVWSLSADKKILTISTSAQDPKGEVTITQVYKKVQ